MEIDKIATLRLQPEDILVLNFEGKLSEKLHDQLQHSLNRIKVANQIIILEQGMTLQVLKPALQWTSELPTKEGLYWWKLRPEFAPTIIKIECDDYQRLTVADPDETIYLHNFEGGKWHGPIEPPEYP